jgi:c-di-AMP phosphodiesterase-like protein
MQSDFDTAMRKFELVRMARLYKRGIAVAVTAEKQSRMAVAQAADELLGIAGVSASFVMSPEERAGEFHVSGRSIGRINAQLICERLGGGGNQSTAGATIRDENPQAAAAKMLRAIDEYLEEHLKENTTEE